MSYTLDETATMLGLHSSTLRFWEEAFRQELNVGRDVHGRLCFDDRHLRAIVEIYQWVVVEKLPLAEARRQLGKWLRAGADAAETTRKPSNEQPAKSSKSNTKEQVVPELEPNPEPEQTARRSSEPPFEPFTDAVGIVKTFEMLSHRITELGETVGYLVEENRALQELIGRLIHYVEGIGESRTREMSRERFSGTTTRSDTVSRPSIVKTAKLNADRVAAVETGPERVGARSSGGSPGGTQPQTSHPAGATRPRLTLAEKRALIAAEREAARARSAATSDTLSNDSPSSDSQSSDTLSSGSPIGDLGTEGSRAQSLDNGAPDRQSAHGAHLTDQSGRADIARPSDSQHPITTETSAGSITQLDASIAESSAEAGPSTVGQGIGPEAVEHRERTMRPWQPRKLDLDEIAHASLKGLSQ